MANKNEQGVLDNETLIKSEAFFDKNKKAIIIAVLAIIIIVVGGFLYKAYVAEPREEKASTELAKGQEYFNAEQFDKALNGDGAGFTGLLNIINNYGSTDAANLANLYTGLCYANLNKWNEAVKYLDEYSPADDAMLISWIRLSTTSRKLLTWLTVRAETASTTRFLLLSASKLQSFWRAKERKMMH